VEADLLVPVGAEPVQVGTIRGVVSGTGLVTTLPGAELSIVAPQPARIAEVTKNVGDPVKAGDLLVLFEFPSLRTELAARAAAVRAAELRMKNAKTVQERVRGLIERGAASRMEGDAADREVTEADAELAEARAAQSAAEAQGKTTSIRAPFNGVVSQRLHNPGDTVGNADNDVIIRVIDPKQVQVTATIALSDAKRFAVGATARVVAEGKGTTELTRVASRPEPEPGASMSMATLNFDAPTELAPGTQVAIEIDAEQRLNVPLVPAIAVVRDPRDGDAVFVVSSDNVAKRRPIVAGLVDTEHIEVTSGVKPGELIITQGLSNVRDGTPVTIAK
jgi:multidrug efflux system membrane fusion protein